MSDTKHKLETVAVHAGDRKPLGDYIPTTTPIFGASSYFYDSAKKLDEVFEGAEEGQNYSRYGNPTVAALEELVATLEAASFCVATASGMAALHLALLAAMVDRKRSVVAANVLYGQSLTLLTHVLEPTGVSVRFADPCDLEAFETAVEKEKPACVLIEPINNPLLRVPELDRLVEVAHRHGALVVVDSTFATPVLFRPLLLGADLVVHSVTKYLAGHGDVLGGVVVAGEEHRQVLTALSRTLGPNLGAFEAYLAMRGIKTLALRMQRQCDNARQLAAWLEGEARVARVHFPGHASHPDHAAARRLFGGELFGAVVSFEIDGAERDDVFSFLDRLQLVVPATTIGDVHSLMLYPAMSSHRDLAPKHRERLGIGDNLVRLSVGIEAVEDVRADLAQALAAI